VLPLLLWPLLRLFERVGSGLPLALRLALRRLSRRPAPQRSGR
jgi:putative ABC transport system permease protein